MWLRHMILEKEEKCCVTSMGSYQMASAKHLQWQLSEYFIEAKHSHPCLSTGAFSMIRIGGQPKGTVGWARLEIGRPRAL